MMSNRLIQLIQLVPDFSPTLDFQPDQLPATGGADINAFDLHRTYGLRKIRGFTPPRRLPLAKSSLRGGDTDLVSHGKIPLGHFYNNHLYLGKIMGYFTDRLARLGGLAKRWNFSGRQFTPGG